MSILPFSVFAADPSVGQEFVALVVTPLLYFVSHFLRVIAPRPTSRVIRFPEELQQRPVMVTDRDLRVGKVAQVSDNGKVLMFNAVFDALERRHVPQRWFMVRRGPSMKAGSEERRFSREGKLATNVHYFATREEAEKWYEEIWALIDAENSQGSQPASLMSPTLELEEAVEALHPAPKLLLEWPSRWSEFLSSIKPALARSEARLAGEAPFGLIPFRVVIPAYVLEAFLILSAIKY